MASLAGQAAALHVLLEDEWKHLHNEIEKVQEHQRKHLSNVLKNMIPSYHDQIGGDSQDESLAQNLAPAEDLPGKHTVAQTVRADARSIHSLRAGVSPDSSIPARRFKANHADIVDSPFDVAARQALGFHAQQTLGTLRTTDTATTDQTVDTDRTLLEQLESYMNYRPGSLSSQPKAGTCTCFRPIRRCMLRQYLEYQDLREPPRTGCFAQFVDGVFETFCSIVILANVIFMVRWADAEIANPTREPPAGQRYLEIAFVIFYIVELVSKLSVHRVFFFIGNSAGWNLFDTILVCTSSFLVIHSVEAGSAGNIGFLRMLRLLKLARVLRVARVLKIFRELRLILNSLIGSLRSLFWSLVMVFMVYFTFSLLFVQIVAHYFTESGVDSDPSEWDEICFYFGSVSGGMLTLFQGSTGADWTEAYGKIAPIGWGMRSSYIFFVAFINISLLNIVTGMFVENAMKLAQPDVETQAIQEMQDELKKADDIYKIAVEMDPDNDGLMSRKDFVRLISHPRIMAELAVLGIPVKDAEFFFNILSAAHPGGDGQVPLDLFVEGCLRMRGNATSVDIHALSYRVIMMDASQRQFINSCNEQLRELSESLHALSASSSRQLTKNVWRSSTGDACEQSDEQLGLRAVYL